MSACRRSGRRISPGSAPRPRRARSIPSTCATPPNMRKATRRLRLGARRATRPGHRRVARGARRPRRALRRRRRARPDGGVVAGPDGLGRLRAGRGHGPARHRPGAGGAPGGPAGRPAITPDALATRPIPRWSISPAARPTGAATSRRVARLRAGAGARPRRPAGRRPDRADLAGRPDRGGEPRRGAGRDGASGIAARRGHPRLGGGGQAAGDRGPLPVGAGRHLQAALRGHRQRPRRDAGLHRLGIAARGAARQRRHRAVPCRPRGRRRRR